MDFPQQQVAPSPKMNRRVGLVPLVLALAACADTTDSAPETLVRDSAGVRIVETTATLRRPAPFVVDTAPAWSVGAVEGDPAYLLSRVVGAITLPGGDVLIGNGGAPQLRFYDERGALVRSVGREGEGPGEFEYIRGLGRCRPGGFVAFDLNWQMNAYTDDGRFLERTALRAPDGITPYRLACDPHGHVVILGWGRQAGERRLGFYASHDRLVLVDAAGGVVSDFGQRLVSERIGTTGGSRPHPAGRATAFDLHDDLLYVGSGEGFEIELRALDGSLRSLVRGPRIPLEVSDSVKAAYLEGVVERASPERRPALRREIADWEWPERLPAFTDLRVDPDGVAWVRAFSLDAEEPERWSLLDPERGYLGDVTLVPGWTLLEIGPGHLLVRTRDELDVERVVRVGLDRGGHP